MANQFIGLQMRVVLRDPPGYQLIGTVRDVEAGSSLSLTNVFVVATQEHLPHMRINALNIADLSELAKEQQQPPPPVYDAPTPTQPTSYASQTTSPTKSNFVDPAILSMVDPIAPLGPALSDLVKREGKKKKRRESQITRRKKRRKQTAVGRCLALHVNAPLASRPGRICM
ncbi:hypothetical protein NLG97_g4 [Lecanicillium saksenae]|uniref:Uncharacterized protein n=1 Tax=Lecanicillium saksenae TaxID=468837 RepID=A0ACC1RBY1_9HYPO|nr:hypothetical protein NLG97_g4 [Lecanicillium saksenae]